MLNEMCNDCQKSGQTFQYGIHLMRRAMTVKNVDKHFNMEYA